MSNLATVLEWKFPGEDGIETKEGILTAWPAKLGAFPSAADLGMWTAEYNASRKHLDEREIEARATQGIGLDDRIDALWRRIVRGETTATDAIEAKLQAIIAKHPKP